MGEDEKLGPRQRRNDLRDCAVEILLELVLPYAEDRPAERS